MNDETPELLSSLFESLKSLGPELAPDLARDESSVQLFGKGLRIEAIAHHDPGAHPAIGHVHVTATIGRGPVFSLDACVVGVNAVRAKALDDAIRTWTILAAPPILSLLHQRPVLGARHFHGKEAWGVEGRHGFVGPLGARFGRGLDLARISEVALFKDAASLASADLVHLGKVTLNVGPGGWQRIIEVGAHGASHTDEPFDVGVPPPAEALLSAFALFFSVPESS